MVKLFGAGSTHSWEQLATKFLKEIFPAQNIKKLKREIQYIQQKDGDLFFEAWKDFKSLIPKCPNHNHTRGELVESFYECLNDTNKGIVDFAVRGVLMEKRGEKAF